MGILKFAAKAAAAAGIAYAGMKISEKYKAKEPQGTAGQKIDALTDSAAEFYKEVSAVVKEKAPGVISGVEAGVQKAVDTAKSVAPEAVTAVENTYNQVASTVKEKAPGVAEAVSKAVNTVNEKIQEYAASENAAASDFDDVVDAAEADIEVEVFEEKTEE